MAPPTIAVDVVQTASNLPYQLTSLRVAMSKFQNLDSQFGGTWTLSSQGTNEHYLREGGGNPASALTSGTIRDVRAVQTDPFDLRPFHMKRGTLGSLNPGEYAWGDNDSLGYPTLYVRLADLGKPDITLSGMTNTDYNQTYIRAAQDGTMGASDVWNSSEGAQRLYYHDTGSTFYVIYWDAVGSEWVVGTTARDPNTITGSDWGDGVTIADLSGKESLTALTIANGSSGIPSDADANVTHDQTDFNAADRAPANEEVTIVWDEILSGDGSPLEDMTFEWWPDPDHAPTQAALSGFGTGDFTQYIRWGTDPDTARTELPVDVLGTVPTADFGSCRQGPFIDLPLPEGSYRFKCRGTNPMLESSTVDVEFSVNAETRGTPVGTFATVNNSGADYTSVGAALTANERLIEMGSGYDDSNMGVINPDDDTLIVFNGTGTKPRWNQDVNTMRLQLRSRGVGIVGVDLRPTSTSSRDAMFISRQSGTGAQQSYLAGVNVVSGSGTFASGFSVSPVAGDSATSPRGVAFFNCTIEDDTYRGYGIGGDVDPQPVGWVSAFSSYFGHSTNESSARTTGLFFGLWMHYSTFDEDSKDGIRFTYGENHGTHRCLISNAAIRIGRSGNRLQRADRIRNEGTLFDYSLTPSTSGLAPLSFFRGQKGVMSSSCILRTQTAIVCASGAADPGLVPDPFPGYQLQEDIKFRGSTWNTTASDQPVFSANGQVDDTHVNNNDISGCLFVTNGTPTPTSNTPNSKWAFVDNQQIDGSLNADYSVDGAGTTSAAVGSIYDYFGRVRGANNTRGAVVPAAISVTTPEQIPSRDLHPVRRRLASPSGHVPVILVGDSNCEDRMDRVMHGIRLAWDTVHKKISISPNTGGSSFYAGGTGSQFIDVGGAAGTGTNILPGDSSLGGGLLTGLSSTAYRYPCRGMKHIWDTAFSGAHFSRLLVMRMEHGEQMEDKDGNLAALYALGDPTLNDDIRFYFPRLGNTDGDTWSQEIQTDSDPEGDGTWANSQNDGYATDATVASTALGIIVDSRSAAETNTGTGMSARIKHTSTDDGAGRENRSSYFLPVWFDNESVTNGISVWTCGIGSTNTTDHAGPTIGGVSNTDQKYDVAPAAEWVEKCVALDCNDVVIRIQLGENRVIGGSFDEGSGTDIGNYKANMEAVIDHWRNICSAAGKTPYFYIVSTQNTVSGGERFLALAQACDEIAAAASDVGFFDLRGAAIDGGFTDANDLMLSSISADGVHTTQLGADEFASLEWAAISTATQTSGLRSRDRSRER